MGITQSPESHVTFRNFGCCCYCFTGISLDTSTVLSLLKQLLNI